MIKWWTMSNNRYQTAALQLSGHHACTSRMWETRKLELSVFKKILLLFGHLVIWSNSHIRLPMVSNMFSLWLWEFWKLVEFGTKTAALQLFGHYACSSRIRETRKLELSWFKETILSFGQEIACHFWMGQVLNIQISWVICPYLVWGDFYHRKSQNYLDFRIFDRTFFRLDPGHFDHLMRPRFQPQQPQSNSSCQFPYEKLFVCLEFKLGGIRLWSNTPF